MIKILIVKELKDLIRDPRIWIPFIISAIIMPAIGLAMSIPMKSSQEELAKPINLGIVNLDEGKIASDLIKYIDVNSKLFRVKTYVVDKSLFKNISVDESFCNNIIKYFEENRVNVDLIILFPEDFSEKFRLREKPSIVMISIVKDISIFSGIKGARINSLIANYIREKYLEDTNISLNVILDPYRSQSLTYLKGKERIFHGDPARLVSSLGLASLLLPLMLMLISVSAMQMSATSMAVENEEKTLETLLTFPIPRTHILFAKLIGSFIVATIGSMLNIIGFIVYMYTFTFSINGANFFDTSTLLISMEDYVLISMSIVATVLFTATLGVVIGALSSDVRIASTITSPISMAIMIPGFFISYSNISSLDPVVRVILYCIPLTQPMIMIKQAIYSSLPIETIIYLFISIISSIILIYITANFFSLEKLSNIQRKIMRRRYKKP